MKYKIPVSCLYDSKKKDYAVTNDGSYCAINQNDREAVQKIEGNGQYNSLKIIAS
ncbi:hypothetical protein [Cytobacillus firmus]|uniref:hypothetical protein n=1 Tax=Cytobacillus firmus TaxID=1399 RepID=UPI00202DFB10|nr:hypothetical protein [Cytobacillus firmus]URT71459.1 hypothetical protein NAF01_03015 [Cytobacillus firmus]